jgi:hypothetical protein
MANELPCQSSLSTKGWIAEDDARARKSHREEIGTLDGRVFGINVIPQSSRNSEEEDTFAGRGFNPLRSCRSVSPHPLKAEFCNVRAGVELIFLISLKSSRGHHTKVPCVSHPVRFAPVKTDS